jgi:hypothetical protein
MKAVMHASQQFIKVITLDPIGSPTPMWPAAFGGTPPEPMPDTGVFERIDDLVKRIRTAPNYTSEVGALLGIIPSKPDPIAPELLKPEPSLISYPGNAIQVHFVRGTNNGLEVEIQVDKDGTWTNAGRFFKSPAELVIPENPQGLARSVQVRARYVKGNSIVGQYSDVDYISTTP